MAGRKSRLDDDAPDLWRCILDREARRDLAALPDRDLVMDAIGTCETLRFDPDLGAEMRRYKDLRRIYFNNDRARIIYRVVRKSRLIQVIRIRARRDAYRGMRNPTT